MGLLGTGSRLYRTLICPASAQLPQEDRPPGKAAIRGSAIHRYYELMAPDSGYEHEEACRVVKDEFPEMNIRRTLDRLVPDPFYRKDGAQYEVKMAYHGATGQASLIHQDGAREYGELGPHDIALTADQVVLGDRIAVGDLKTGDPRNVQPAAENVQLWVTSLCVSKITGATEGEQWIDQLRGYGKTELDIASVTAEKLETFEARVQSSLALAQEVHEHIEADIAPPVFPGENHCRFCPARAACPEFQ